MLNDRDAAVWRAYDIDSWPALVFIDPRGHVTSSHMGEAELDEMEAVVARQEKTFAGKQVLRRGRMDFGEDAKAPAVPAGPIAFPAALALQDETLFVCSWHQVVELSVARGGRAAKVVRVFGSQREDGFSDGPPGIARFRLPQGLALAGDGLIVADSGNNAIRRLDLTSGDVSTLLGPGREWRSAGGKTGLEAHLPHSEADLTSHLRVPTGVASAAGRIFVSVAGARQIWRMDADGGSPVVHAGSGVEGVSDGPQHLARLSQPMGLAEHDGSLYFADVEASSIRRTDIERNGSVSTIVGWELFQSGDKDGRGEFCLMQHPLDLAWYRDGLIVADTYNNKLKVVDEQTAACEEMPGEAGSGEAFDQPAGVCSDGERILVADTNAHRIATVDPETGAVRGVAIE
ncbi:MAG: hypothetical protein C4521_08135 [Actinobacteria bacterium]|nr:MAG: hypothetical protein C4521_08135 [Actinomycetota bacterium]